MFSKFSKCLEFRLVNYGEKYGDTNTRDLSTVNEFVSAFAFI